MRFFILRNILVFASLILSSFVGNSQNELSNWYNGGNNFGIKFPGPVVVPGTTNLIYEACASVSDAAGNILFYTDGDRIWDASNAVMPDGFGISGWRSSAQGVLIVKQPGASDIYYVFTTDGAENGFSNGLRYTIVDMSLQGNGIPGSPLGNVVLASKNVLIQNSSMEAVAATSHENCEDVWILGHEFGNNIFQAHLLTSVGISVGPSSAVGSIRSNVNVDIGRGIMSFSPDGSKVALSSNDYINNTDVDLLNFDNATGQVTSLIANISSGGLSDSYGLCFSPNNNILYITYLNNAVLKQFDLTAADIPGSANILYSPGGPVPGMGNLLLAPDGKIYIARNGTSYMSTINNPNTLGAGAGFVNNGFDAGGGNFFGYGVPQVFIPKTAPSITSVSKTDETCAALGTINITATSGTPTYNYSINGGVSFQLSNIFNSVPAGNYSIVVEDQNGCFKTSNITVDPPNAPSIDNVSKTDVTCTTLGDITISASGGTAPLEYSIDAGASYQPSNLFTGLSSGTYSIRVRDASGCIDNSSININGNLAPSIDNITKNDVTCSSLGNITITASGGTTPLEYSVDGGISYQPSNVFSGLSSGAYNIRVRDASGCIVNSSININGNLAPTIDNVTKNDVSCSTLGDITITATKGTAPLEYSIDAGVSYQPSNFFPGLNAGAYNIRVRDALGCISNSSIIINGNLAPSINSVTKNDVTCSLPGEITIIASGGNGALQYSINGGVSYQASNTFTGLIAGIYTSS